MAANSEAHYLSFLVDLGVVPTTNVAKVPICGYELPRAHMCRTCVSLENEGLIPQPIR